MEEAIFYVEMETSQRIDWNYPLFKFISLLECLSRHGEKVKNETDKIGK